MAKTILGKWSIGLILAMPILFAVGASFTTSLYKSVPAGDTILADLTNRPVLAITMLAGFAAGISAFVTGLLAILKQKERTVLVYLSTLAGAGVILFSIGEFLYPH